MGESWEFSGRLAQWFKTFIILDMKLWRDHFHFKVKYQGDGAGMSLGIT